MSKYDWMDDSKCVCLRGFGSEIWICLFATLLSCYVVWQVHVQTLWTMGESYRVYLSHITSQTLLMNANWVFFVFMHFTSSEILVCSSETDTSVMCERLRVHSAHWVSEGNSPESGFLYRAKTGHWTHHCSFIPTLYHGFKSHPNLHFTQF